jgi:hypothetical protein
VYDLLPPAELFRQVFHRVVETGGRLAIQAERAVEAHETDAEGERDAALRDTLLSFLHSLAGYLDGCKCIITCLSSGRKTSEKTFAAFRKSILDYHTHVMIVVNNIKHRHRMLRTLYGLWPEGGMVGYLVEGPNGERTIGQDSAVHKANTAFSLNRNLRYHACHIYFVAAALKSALDLPDTSATGDPESRTASRKAGEFLAAVAALPLHLFPDETVLPLPNVRVTSDQRVRLDYPAPFPPGTRQTPVKRFTFRFDASPSTSYAIPYLARRDYTKR